MDTAKLSLISVIISASTASDYRTLADACVMMTRDGAAALGGSATSMRDQATQLSRI